MPMSRDRPRPSSGYTPTRGRSDRSRGSGPDRSSSSSSTTPSSNSRDHIHRKTNPRIPTLLNPLPDSKTRRDKEHILLCSSTQSPAPRRKLSSLARLLMCLVDQKRPSPMPIPSFETAVSALAVPLPSRLWTARPPRLTRPLLSDPSFRLTTLRCLWTSKPTGLRR